MGNVTKLSISLPTPVADALKREAADLGVPLSQLLTEALERRTRAARFRQTLSLTYGPITDADREAGRMLLATARTPDEILGDG